MCVFLQHTQHTHTNIHPLVVPILFWQARLLLRLMCCSAPGASVYVRIVVTLLSTLLRPVMSTHLFDKSIADTARAPHTQRHTLQARASIRSIHTTPLQTIPGLMLNVTQPGSYQIYPYHPTTLSLHSFSPKQAFIFSHVSY